MKKATSPYSARLLTKEDNWQMLEILQLSPIKSGGLSICFDREPDIFLMANLKYDPAKYIGVFQVERLLGFGLIGYHTGMIAGIPQKVYHFSNVFMRREFRGRGLFFRAQNLFFKEINQKEIPGYAVIMKGNKNAERLIGWNSGKFPLIPYSTLLHTYDARNILIAFRKRESRLAVRKAEPKDIIAIVALLKSEFAERIFAPDINVEKFNHNLSVRPNFSIKNYYVVEKENRIIGTCAAWDCSSFKQIRILKYSRRIRIVKTIYSVFSTLFRFPKLPTTGDSFKAVYITDCAVESRDPEIMNAIFRKIYNEYRTKKFNIIVFGSFKGDNLLQATKGFFYQSVESNVYLFHSNKDMLGQLKQENQMPYIDIAFL